MSKKQVVGQRVKRIRKLGKKEKDQLGWDDRRDVVGIELENGTFIFASCDDEGNAPGTMFVDTADGGSAYLFNMKGEND